MKTSTLFWLGIVLALLVYIISAYYAEIRQFMVSYYVEILCTWSIYSILEFVFYNYVDYLEFEEDLLSAKIPVHWDYISIYPRFWFNIIFYIFAIVASIILLISIGSKSIVKFNKFIDEKFD